MLSVTVMVQSIGVKESALGAATTAVVPIGADGAICLAAADADTHYSLDAVGYVS